MGQEKIEEIVVPVEKILELREKFFERYDRDGHKIQGGFHKADIERIKNRKKWLQRFLEYNDLDIQASCDQLWQSCIFRKNNNINDTNETTICMDLMREGMVFPRNHDRDGKRLLIFKSKLYIRGANNMDDMKKNLLYYIERLYRETDMERISVVFDMAGCGLANMDLNYTKYIIDLFKLYYPNSLNYIIIYDMPWILNATFKIIKSLLPPKAVSRMKFVNSKSIKEVIDEDNLLVAWGGQDDYQYEFTPQDPKVQILPFDDDQSMTDDGNNNDVYIVNKNSSQINGIVSKKVHFISNNTMSPAESPMSESPPTNFKTEDKRLKILDEGIIFKSRNNEVYGTVSIKNISDETVVFKVKTTSPEKFRVSPPAGMIRSGQVEKITINLVQGYELGSNRDKFLIMCKPLDEDQTEEGLSVDAIHKEFKSSLETNSTIEMHRIRCIYPASGEHNEVQKSAEAVDSHSAQYRGMAPADWQHAMSNSPVGLSDQVQRLERQIRFSQTLQYVTILLFFVLSLAIVYLLKMEIKQNSAEYCSSLEAEATIAANIPR